MKKKNLLYRVIIIAIVTVVGLYLVIGPRRRPTLKDFTWSGIKASLASNIQLGLDLQGGLHLVMRVKTEEFLRKLTEDNYTAAQNAAKDAGYEIKGGQPQRGECKARRRPSVLTQWRGLKPEAARRRGDLGLATVGGDRPVRRVAVGAFERLLQYNGAVRRKCEARGARGVRHRLPERQQLELHFVAKLSGDGVHVREARVVGGAILPEHERADALAVAAEERELDLPAGCEW